MYFTCEIVIIIISLIMLNFLLCVLRVSVLNYRSVLNYHYGH